MNIHNNNKQENTKDSEQSVPRIIQVLLYLYNILHPFTLRESIGKIYARFECQSPTQSIRNLMKELFGSLGLEPHKSGEYPSPVNIEDFEYLKYVIFNADCTKFHVPEKNRFSFRNETEYNLYLQARAVFLDKYYEGSEEEEKAIAQKKDRLAYEVNYLNEHVNLPEGCYFAGTYPDVVTLHITGLDDHIKIFKEWDEHSHFLDKQLMPEMRKGFDYRYPHNLYFHKWDDSIEVKKDFLETECFKVLDKYDSQTLYEEYKGMISKLVEPHNSEELNSMVESFFQSRIKQAS